MPTPTQDSPTYFFVEDPAEPLTKTFERLNEVTGQRLGYGRCIELALPEACLLMQQNWNTFITRDFKLSWNAQFKYNEAFLDEVPDIGPEEPENNPTTTEPNTGDTPTSVYKTQIRYFITRSENAGFNRKMFASLKELKPRFRFYISRMKDPILKTREIIKVLAKTSEHEVVWTVYARNLAEADFIYKCLEYIFRCHANLFYSLGFQRFIPLGGYGVSRDKSTNLRRKVLRSYFRIEEFFSEPPIVAISSVEFDWNNLNELKTNIKEDI